MGAAGKPERKSERKTAANRVNAQKPRPRARKLPVEAEELVKESLARLRALLPRAVEVAGELLEHPNPEVRLRAAREVFDRGALPRRTEGEVAMLAAIEPKLFDLRGFGPEAEDPRHRPPPGWTDQPPPVNPDLSEPAM